MHPTIRNFVSLWKYVLRGFVAGISAGGLFALCCISTGHFMPVARAEAGAVNPELKAAHLATDKSSIDLTQQDQSGGPMEETKTPQEARQEAKAKIAIDSAVRDGLQHASDTAKVQAKAFFAYSPTGLYEIFCHEGALTDIQMQSGEEILYIGGGDTARWLVDKAQSGSGDQKQWHIYVKPLKANITTNFVITTDRRSYQIRARASSFYNPIIGWTYPQDERAAFLRQQAERARKEEGEISQSVSPDKMNFAYKVIEKSGFFGSSYSWTPKMVFDDGTKTYIQMADTMRSGEAPALFVKDDDNVTLVNYRVKNNYYIVDRLFAQAEMRNGTKETVIIKRTNK